MVHWAWIPITLVIGIFIAISIIIFMKTERDDGKDKKWWEE